MTTTDQPVPTIHQKIRQFLLDSEQEKSRFIGHMVGAMAKGHMTALDADQEVLTYFLYDVLKLPDFKFSSKIPCVEHGYHSVDPLLAVQIGETVLCYVDQTALINEFMLHEGFTDERPQGHLTDHKDGYGCNVATWAWWMIVNNDSAMHHECTTITENLQYKWGEHSRPPIARAFEHMTMRFLQRYISVAPLPAQRKLLLKWLFDYWLSCVDWSNMAQSFMGHR